MSGQRFGKQKWSLEDIKITAQKSDGSESFQILTKPEGYNSGRSYYLKADSTRACKELVDNLQRLVSIAKARAESITRFQRSQQIARRVYESTPFQIGSSLLIILV
jgi:hypothetical protein